MSCCSASPSPLGLLQMLVDDIGDVTITNDGATILKLLEVEHPAARVRTGGACCRGGCGCRTNEQWVCAANWDARCTPHALECQWASQPAT